MTAGLSVADVVSVNVTLSPVAVPTRNFGSLLIIGGSTVISTTERLREYTSITAVASDFGTTAPEYLAAALFFSQVPSPSFVYIGRWAKSATSATLIGGALTTSQQSLANFTSITAGAFDITIDGTLKHISGLNFSGAANLNAVASDITTALGAAGACTWDSTYGRFVITDATTGTSSTITFASTPASGTDVSAQLGLTSATGATVANGITQETPVAAVQALADFSRDWYGCMFADTSVTDAQHEAVSAYIEGTGSSNARIYGITTSENTVPDSTHTDDLASVLQAAKYNRTFVQYSTTNSYAVASFFGRAFTVDPTGSNTFITMKFKVEPGVTAETLTETQAQTLASKNCNVYVGYSNGAAIIQQGVMSSGIYFDEQFGADWVQNAIQTAVFNVFYTFPKVPQTDSGVHLIVTNVEAELSQGVTNGWLAPGVWNGPSIGPLQTGFYLGKGFFTYAPSIDSQSQADREARKSPTIQVAAKLAGAVHFANIIVNCNR
jgi:hypothetical protein